MTARSAVVLVVVALTACGGGAAGSRADTPPPPLEPTLVAAPDGRADAAGTAEDPLGLRAALERAIPGDVVQLTPGTYPALKDDIVRTGTVTVVGQPPEGPGGVRAQRATRIAGATLNGATGLAFRDIAFDGPVIVRSHPMRKTQQTPRDISFQRVEITAPGANCLMVRDRAQRIKVRDSWIHDCGRGIAGPGFRGVGRSSGIAIRHNLLERFTVDGIAFGSWDDVVIDRNIIREMRDPGVGKHNDGIQFFGNSTNVRITRNRVSGSDAQLVLVQPAVGPIEDVLMASNVMTGSGGFGIQVWGTPGFRLINNTVWGTRYAAVLLRETGARGTVANDTVIVNNVLSGLRYLNGARPRLRRNNFLTQADGRPGRGDVFGRTPGFADPERNDLRPRPRSRIVDRADRRFAPPTDVLGRPRGRTPNIGAFG